MSVCRYVTGNWAVSHEVDASDRLSNAVAVIAVAGRFPGGNDVDGLWQDLLAGRDLVTRFDLTGLEDAVSAEDRRDPSYVAARSVLEGVDQFDAAFFGMKPREAELTDPQQRVFLEICRQAFDAAGRRPSESPSVGVFAGASTNTYFLHHVLSDREAVEDFTSQFQIGRYAEVLGNHADLLALRVSYKLGLTGPSVTVGTACSTSLTAVTLACQSLQMFQCDMALAGGVSITFPQARGYRYSEGGMGSADGTCRPYDAHSNGTVFGHGAGVVLLKRYDDAVRDGDRVLAVIAGYGVVNDGSGKVGFTAPSVEGQAAAMRAAYAMADIDPVTVGYVEGHGTATPLGDPIEVAALTSVIGGGGPEALPCHLGSIKANIGHLDSAAGVAGLIKAVLVLDREVIPPLAHYTAPNPRLPLDGSRIVLDAQATPWPRSGSGSPRRAAVNALGVGGTNVHVVLEEAPDLGSGAAAPSAPVEAVEILPLSAKSRAALAHMASDLADVLSRPDAPKLADAATTLIHGRERYEHRFAVAASDVATAAKRLREGAAALSGSTSNSGVRRLAFLFPGQGTQYSNMGRELYRSNPTFRRDVDTGIDIASAALGTDLRAHLFRDPDDPGADSGRANRATIRSTVFAQPALFIVQHALAREHIRCGARPDALIGHSLGEFAAATIAGVFEYESALRFVATRARLMVDLPAGAMLGVRLSASEVMARLPATLDIAAVNGRTSTVVAGPVDEIEAFAAQLAVDGIACRQLQTSHAFHSRMVDPVVEPLRAALGNIRLSAPAVPIASTVTGTWLTATDAMSPDYWAGHARATVRFGDAVAKLIDGSPLLAVEVGPGATLSTLVRQNATRSTDGRDAVRDVVAVASLPDADGPENADLVLAEARAAMFAAGVDIDLAEVSGRAGRRVQLPAYRFDRQSYFIDAPVRSTTAKDPTARDVTERGDRQPTAPAFAQSTSSTLDEPDPMPTPTPTLPQPAIATSSKIGTHRQRLADAVVEIVSEISGEALGADRRDVAFLDLGYDSLMLGQIAQRLNKAYKCGITFRQLMSSCPTVDAVAALLAEKVPDEAPSEPVAVASPMPVVTPVTAPVSTPVATSVLPVVSQAIAAQPVGTTADVGGSALESLFRDQLAAMQQVITSQIAALSGGASVVAGSAAPVAQASVPKAVTAPIPPAIRPAQTIAVPPALRPAEATAAASAEPSRFETFIVKGGAASEGLTPVQQRFIADLVARLEQKMPGSKAYAQRHRARLADPRAAAGFNRRWKELVFPVVANGASGSRIVDIDGNSYIDIVNGFGQTAFGHSPPFVIAAVERQMRDGFPIGPQCDLAGEVADMLCDMTGNDRATFCNTGSEAVMAAMRVARTVTGRDRIVFFQGAYHGQFDEVLAKPGARSGSKRALPAAPGIPMENLGNIVVLPYAEAESLDWIRANADEVAAVIVEPVQSRRPTLRPREFLAELRAITADCGAALVFDEVVTGFRVAVGGMQSVYGIRADMATYGKVLGGGFPIGVLAGNTRFMDALDGGQWQFGDDSVPEVPPTFLAGTFVRHPLALAAAKAVLAHLKREGQPLLDAIGAKATALATRVNADLEARGLATRVEHYASWLYTVPSKEAPLASLFFPHMRLLGIHAQEGFPWFLTSAHTDTDVLAIGDAVIASVDALQEAEILGGRRTASLIANRPVEVAPSAAMREVYLAAQLGDRASIAFNEGLTLHLSGTLDRDAMVAACRDAIARHPILTAGLGETGETLTVRAAGDITVPVVDISGTENREAALAEIVRADQAQPFDLADGPLIRVQLVAMGPSEHALVVCGHHIAFDGWSAAVIVREIGALYQARCNHAQGKQVRGTGTPVDLPPPPPLAASLRPIAAAGSPTDAYWLDRFRNPPDPLELPTDRPRPVRKSWRGATAYGAIDRDLAGRIRRFSKSAGATPFATLLTGLCCVLSRLTGQTDLAVLVPMAGQQLADSDGADTDGIVGHLVNFLPIRVVVEPDDTPVAQVGRVRDVLFEAYEHQDYTLGRLVERLGQPRDFARTPISDVQFNLESEIADPGFGDLDCRMRSNPKQAVNTDLFFNLVETADGIRVEVDYATDLYDAATIERWIGHLVTLLDGLTRPVAAPTTVVGLPIMTATEIAALLDPSLTARAFPADRLLHELIAETASRCPDRVAVVHRERSMTYRELDRLASRIAAVLAETIDQGNAGASAKAGRPQRRIAIAIDRSVDMVATLLAVWKAGDAFVPLDPSHPVARLGQTMAAGTVDAVVASDPAILEAAPAGAVRVALSTLLAAAARSDGDRGDTDRATVHRRAAPTDAAYVIFTSGSTGVPKGVEVGNRALVNFMTSMVAEPGLSERDVLLAVTTICFDIAQLELFGPLLAGGRVVLADRVQALDGFALVDLIRDAGITVMQATPSTWRLLIEGGLERTPDLTMLCGGEPLPRDLADQLLDRGGALWNLYGPTETTVWSAVERVRRGEPIRIGRPIANTELVVLDSGGQPAPVGVVGELLIGGVGLANGYVGRPDLTETAFRERAFGGRPARRYYHTGDVAVRHADGRFVLKGRRDQQIKLRGFRIELEEIEAVLRADDRVAGAAVTVVGATGEERLAALVVPRAGAAPTGEVLAAQARRALPEYMVPAAWQIVERLPTTANGKLDRKALPALVERQTPGVVAPRPVPAVQAAPVQAVPGAATATDAAHAALHPLHATIAGAFADLLGGVVPGPDDDLLMLGLDSLRLFRAVANLRRNGIRIDAAQVYATPTVARLAEAAATAALKDPAGGRDAASAAKQPQLSAYRGGQRRPGRQP